MSQTPVIPPKLDLPATYEWGKQELKAINDRMWELAKLINPSAKTLREVADTLENDPKYRGEGPENVIKYLQDFTDAAMKRLNGEFFDIDPRVAICEARLAPEGSASAPYYNPPSEDLSRPGTTWIPMLGKNEVSNWHLVSTWYHEAGVHPDPLSHLVGDRLSWPAKVAICLAA